MKFKRMFFYLFVLLVHSFSVIGQDTLRLHYANATVSEVIASEDGIGAITGKGSDGSVGKSMYFDSGQHRSPETVLLAILMDLEVSNYTAQDSFTVFVNEAPNDYSINDKWEMTFPFSAVAVESSSIPSTDIGTYNFSVALDGSFSAIPDLRFDVGIKYDPTSSASIALRATGDGEFDEAATRTFTHNADGSVTDFVTAYDKSVSLAIYPVTRTSGGVNDLSDLGFDIVDRQDGFIEVIGDVEAIVDYQLRLFDVQGKLVYESMMDYTGSKRILTSNLSSGVYTLRMSNKESFGSRKIFVR